ncbi:MAG TPA: hypothetical protein DDZ88_20615 [Verrucomicrobiales bacterium]|nr:hypothetical protein [Verrucomicrobiales bacterium]
MWHERPGANFPANEFAHAERVNAAEKWQSAYRREELPPTHIAWARRESHARLIDITAANLNAFLAGKPVAFDAAR